MVTARHKTRIRRARRGDLERIAAIAGDVFEVYGADYGAVIPGYARDGGVVTFISEEGADLVGFIQIGFLESPHHRRQLVADILSVAVAPGFQGQGRGTDLFNKAFEFLRPLLRKGSLVDIQLTVAHTNDNAARLFQRLGFVVLDEQYGYYERGQRAIRMGMSPETRRRHTS